MLWLILAACFSGPLSGEVKAESQSLTIFAAASLKEVLDALADIYEEQSGTSIRLSYGGSGSLAKQIEQGAPADLYVSAHPDWLGYLDDKGVLGADQDRLVIASNQLVLITGSAARRDLVEAAPLANGASRAMAAVLSGPDRFAVPNVASVPAGIYAKQALMALGLWQDLKDKAAFTHDVRASLALVATGALPAGIVYRTDARADGRVRIVYRFSPELHEPIVYSAAMINHTKTPAAARAFLTFLVSDAAKAAFEKAGFVWRGGQRRSADDSTNNDG